MVVTCKVISLFKTSKEDRMFIPEKDFSFEDLIRWVYRNCPGERKIVIENNCVQAHYEERVELYYIREGE
jgi:hypothetical protein